MLARSKERSLQQLPRVLIMAFLLAFAVQITYQVSSKSSLRQAFRHLEPPLETGFYSSLTQGSQDLWSYLLMLKVQLHDNQRGRHESYNNLDYKTLSQWLLSLSQLNPHSDYPAFLAARVYSQVQDPQKIRIVIQVIEKLFEQNPVLHWRRMTEACLLAKHQLKDLDLALKLAAKIAALPESIILPFWARDMKLILLDELNELESAQLLISSMLQSGAIHDNDEIRFLQSRLLKIRQQMLNSRQ